MIPALLTSMLSLVALAQPATAPAAAPAASTSGPYHVIRTFDVGGEGGWDCVSVDSASHRLFVPRSTHVMVIDTQSGKVAGDIPGTAGVHGVAIAAPLSKGYTSNGRTGDVSVFDLATLKVQKTIKAGQNPDVIMFEPSTQRVFCCNGRSNDVTIINAKDDSVVGTIALGGKPEFVAFDAKGTAFINLEDTSEIVRLDTSAMKVDQRIKLAPGEEPTGLAFDVAHHHLFAACHNEMMVVVDSETGKILATPPIGKNVDGADFDPAGPFAISSNGEGSLTVIGAVGDQPFGVVQTLTTAKGARTVVMDPATRTMYLPTADFEPQAEGQQGRPKMKPGTFKIVVVGV